MRNSFTPVFYNFTIVGAGASGLWLANSMLDHGILKNKTLCIVENDLNKRNDRTWCYWSKTPLGDQEFISKEWQDIKNIYRKNDNKILPYKYYHVNSNDFYEFIKGKLKKNVNIFF